MLQINSKVADIPQLGGGSEDLEGYAQVSGALEMQSTLVVYNVMLMLQSVVN